VSHKKSASFSRSTPPLLEESSLPPATACRCKNHMWEGTRTPGVMKLLGIMCVLLCMWTSPCASHFSPTSNVSCLSQVEVGAIPETVCTYELMYVSVHVPNTCDAKAQLLLSSSSSASHAIQLGVLGTHNGVPDGKLTILRCAAGGPPSRECSVSLVKVLQEEGLDDIETTLTFNTATNVYVRPRPSLSACPTPCVPASKLTPFPTKAVLSWCPSLLQALRCHRSAGVGVPGTGRRRLGELRACRVARPFAAVTLA
jgi:hypothetical protein